MKKQNPSYIQVTKDFTMVVDTFAALLYEKTTEQPPETKAEFIELVYQTINQVLFPADIDSAKLKYNELKLQFVKSGPLGETSYAAPKERQDYGRRKPKTEYKHTERRDPQLNRMKLATDAWNSSAASIKKQWKTTADKEQTTPVGLFSGVYMSLLADNLPIPTPFHPTPELLKYYHSRKSK
ncbi:MAG: hypothetical protein QME64_06140 [bacterium]|nr:hypothetical protein [bacterium]